MKAALSRAAGYVAPNNFETAEPRTCIECGAPLESWQASRCQACIDKSLTGVVIANSIKWQTCDGVVQCVDCQMRDTPDCEKYQEELTEVGRGNDAAPNFWDDGKLSAIEQILTDTQSRRGKPNLVYFLDAGDLCWIGK